MRSPIDLRIESNLPRFRQRWGDIVDRQIPFAQAMALNATAFAARTELTKSIPEHMNAPIKFTRDAPMVFKATKRNMMCAVFLRDEASGGTSPLKYLEANVEGGPRRDKRSETLLKNRRLLGSTQQTVIGKSMRDKFGNMQGGGGMYNRFLSQLQAQHDAYANETARSRKKNPNRARYFVGKPGAGSQPLGVWRRDGKRGLRPVLLFGAKRTYKKRFPFYTIVALMFRDKFMLHFERELGRAMRTAW